MEEKIKLLYMNINYIGYCYAQYFANDYLQKAKKLIPQVEEFASWFLAENQFGIEEDLYQALHKNLLEILNDIVLAVKENDMVLMMDALENGVCEYLTMFVPEEYYEGKRVRITG